MKRLNLLISLTVVALSASPAVAASHSCQKYAEAVALNTMMKQLKEEVAPEELPVDSEPALIETTFVNRKGETTDKDTGIYMIQMEVMEECIDGLTVATKVVKGTNGKASCKVVKITSPFNRDCG